MLKLQSQRTRQNAPEIKNSSGKIYCENTGTHYRVPHQTKKKITNTKIEIKFQQIQYLVLIVVIWTPNFNSIFYVFLLVLAARLPNVFGWSKIGIFFVFYIFFMFFIFSYVFLFFRIFPCCFIC